MYDKTTYDMGWVVQVEKHYPGNYGAPGMARAPKRKRTPEDIARQNERNKVKRVQRIIIMNFKEGDWHLTLTYKKEGRPATLKEAKRCAKRFLDKMRTAYKKAGLPFKYICITEIGKKGACHHHLIIEDITAQNLNTKEMVMEYWPHGMRNFSPLYEDGEFQDLAEYITKKETKGEGHSYTHSRNLAMPKPKRERIHQRTWRKDPKPKKGYYIVKDSVMNGINPVTGYPYQHYTMRRIDGVRGCIKEGIQLREPGRMGSAGPPDHAHRDYRAPRAPL